MDKTQTATDTQSLCVICNKVFTKNHKCVEETAHNHTLVVTPRKKFNINAIS